MEWGGEGLTGNATARMVASSAQTRFMVQSRANVTLKRRSLGAGIGFRGGS